MQLVSEDLCTDAAIKEMEAALPIAFLQNVIARRVADHKPRGELWHRLVMLRAEQIKQEIGA